MSTEPSPRLTVRDVARRVQRRGEDLEVVVNRLRNWTKEGLLEFVGDKHPGTGKMRLYSATAIVDAAVLTAFTDLGLAAVRSTQFKGQHGTFLQYGRFGIAKVFDQSNKDALHFLVLSIVPFGSREPPTITLQRGQDHSEPADHYGIEGKMLRDRGHVLTPRSSPGSVVLNLTEIFRPLHQVVSADLDERTSSVKIDLVVERNRDDGEH
ncbi:hypothetical protein [Nitrobacter sp. JJSN]|uniref:hypothetical protein n=1 Tax=Nitrobacter sp. JJSN TaxID=3453033 RepID=UPI003F762E1F